MGFEAQNNEKRIQVYSFNSHIQHMNQMNFDYVFIIKELLCFLKKRFFVFILDMKKKKISNTKERRKKRLQYKITHITIQYIVIIT